MPLIVKQMTRFHLHTILLKLFCIIVSPFSDKADTVPGYDFLVNSVWPEMIKGIEERLAYLFNPGNPDIFYEVRP